VGEAPVLRQAMSLKPSLLKSWVLLRVLLMPGLKAN